VLFTNSTSSLIIEIGSHNHVVPPLIRILPADLTECWTEENNTRNLKYVLEEYGFESAKVKSIDVGVFRFVCRLLLHKIKNRKTTLIISTYPEYLIRAEMMSKLVMLSLMRSKILCIRNPERWSQLIHGKAKNPETFKLRISRKAARILMRKFIKTSNLLIVENEKQRKYLNERLISESIPNRSLLVFPGRLSNLQPKASSAALNSGGDRNFVGILGSLSETRRDSSFLLNALVQIDHVSRPGVMILGSTNTEESIAIIKCYEDAGIQIFGHPNQTISETEFFLRGSKCFGLVAPFRESWGYGGAMGSGSIADAISLGKPLLIPEFIEFDTSDYPQILKFKDSSQLAEQISTLVRAPVSLDSGTSQYYSSQEMTEVIHKILYEGKTWGEK
jgi:hypothetical protein